MDLQQTAHAALAAAIHSSASTDWSGVLIGRAAWLWYDATIPKLTGGHNAKGDHSVAGGGGIACHHSGVECPDARGRTVGGPPGRFFDVLVEPRRLRARYQAPGPRHQPLRTGSQKLHADRHLGHLRSLWASADRGRPAVRLRSPDENVPIGTVGPGRQPASRELPPTRSRATPGRARKCLKTRKFAAAAG